MKYLLIFLFFVYSLNNSSKTLANIQNKIVVKVENQIVTNYEIKNKILTSLILSGVKVSQENIDRYKKQALKTLIDYKIKENELKKYRINKNEKQINSYLKSISSDNIENLKNSFMVNNLDYDLFLKEVETEMKWQELIYKLYSKKIIIDEKSIDLEIDDLIKNSKKVKEFKISEIEVNFDDNQINDKKIFEIEKQIQDEGFEKTSLKYNKTSSSANKGDLGWINARSLTKEVFEILKDMKIGDISKPIKKQNAVIFLKINDIRNSEVKDLDLVNLRSKLINQRKNELFDLYSKSHLSKLKNNSMIEYK